MEQVLVDNKEKNVIFVTGLPESGQNEFYEVITQCFVETGEQWYYREDSPMPRLLNHINTYDTQNIFSYERTSILKGTYQGYFDAAAQQSKYIFEESKDWVSMINLLEFIDKSPVKMLCMVRNPAEIVATLEKKWKKSPVYVPGEYNSALTALNTSIMSRAFSHASPDGALGKTHTAIRDAVTMGYKDRLLFVDYNRFCNSPKSQLKRIFDFFELNIPIPEKIELKKDTINCVEHLGLDLYQQYNAQIFWDAWV